MPRSTKWQLLLTFIPAISILIMTIVISGQSGLNFREYSGEGKILSNLGVILWCISSCICFFSWILTRTVKSGVNSYFLFYSALFSAYLSIDDFFELHEFYLPYYIGISEKSILVILMMVSVCYFLYFRSIIFKTNYSLLFLSLVFLATAAISDGIFEPLEIIYGIIVASIISAIYLSIFKPLVFRNIGSIVLLIFILCAGFLVIESKMESSEYILEDGAKWLGIACWTSYYIRTSIQFIKNASRASENEVRETFIS